MTVRTLTSSHVNYLVWRYLQEAGYGDSARLLARDWDRNPDSLPFSTSVRPQALVNVIQDGLWIDQVEADLHRTPRRYSFCSRYGLDSQIQNGNAYNDTSNIPLRNGRLLNSEREENAPEESNGVNEHRRKGQTNGIEPSHNNNTFCAQPGKAVIPPSNEGLMLHDDGLSDLEQQKSTATSLIGRSIGVQCDNPVDLTSNSVIFVVKPSVDAVVHTRWSPVDPHTFLVASDRPEFYSVSSTITRSTVVSQINISQSMLNEPAMVTALTWISATDAVLAMWNESANVVEGDLASSKVVMLRSLGTEATVMSSVVQVVFALRWQAETKRLLGVCGNDLNGAVWVWDAATSNTSHFLPLGSPVLDAVWTTGSLCCVCGQNFLRIYKVGDKIDPYRSFSTKTFWEQVKYDEAERVIACISFEQNKFGFIKENGTEIETVDLNDGNSTVMEFQPRPAVSNDIATSKASISKILAIAFDSGVIQLRDARHPNNVVRRLRMDVPAMAIAFSPNGRLLAAAGLDSIAVWSEEGGIIPQASWRAPIEQWITDGSGDDTEAGLDHGLSWNSDGQKLIYTVGNQVAVMSFVNES